MTKEQLMQLGLSEEQSVEAIKILDKNYISKSKYNDDIAKLQGENETNKNGFEKSLKEAKVSNAVYQALMKAKAKNAVTVKPLLDIENLELMEDGTLKGLAEQIEAISKNDDTKFLFDAETTYKGFVPAEKKTTKIEMTKEQFQQLGYKERVFLYNTDIETYNELSKGE